SVDARRWRAMTAVADLAVELDQSSDVLRMSCRIEISEQHAAAEAGDKNPRTPTGRYYETARRRDIGFEHLVRPAPPLSQISGGSRGRHKMSSVIERPAIHAVRRQIHG